MSNLKKDDYAKNYNTTSAKNKSLFNDSNVESITNDLNELRKMIYRSFPNFEIPEIQSIISSINNLESEINKANIARSIRNNVKRRKDKDVVPRVVIIRTSGGLFWNNLYY